MKKSPSEITLEFIEITDKLKTKMSQQKIATLIGYKNQSSIARFRSGTPIPEKAINNVRDLYKECFSDED